MRGQTGPRQRSLHVRRCQVQVREQFNRAPDVPDDFWHSEGMQTALLSRDMGRVSRAYRHHPFHGAVVQQVRLAEWLGLSQGQVSRVERGIHPVRDMDALIHWARTLRLPPGSAWFEVPPVAGGQVDVGPPPAEVGRIQRHATTSGPFPAVQGRAGQGQRADNLPADLTPFVGRAGEVTMLRRLLGQRRLITLVGPGGVGKSRLAVHAMRGLAPSARSRVWLVELGPVTDSGLVLQAVAVPSGSHRRRDAHCWPRSSMPCTRWKRCSCWTTASTCCQRARPRGDTPPRVPSAARAGHQPRAPRLRWEPGSCATLRCPAGGAGALDVAGLARNDAVRLFVERAQAALPAFGLTDATPGRGGGLPAPGRPAPGARAGRRASERADCRAIAARLDDRFRVLTGGSRRPAAHQTLAGRWTGATTCSSRRAGAIRPTLRVRRRLHAGGRRGRLRRSIRAGPAPHVATIGAGDVLDLLLRLVDKSLVVREDGHGEGAQVAEEGAASYRLLETLRAYGEERFAPSSNGARPAASPPGVLPHIGRERRNGETGPGTGTPATAALGGAREPVGGPAMGP